MTNPVAIIQNGKLNWFIASPTDSISKELLKGEHLLYLHKKPLEHPDKIFKLIVDNYCKWEYDDGSVHECYEFSKEELIEFVKEILNGL